jgi:protein gp37
MRRLMAGAEVSLNCTATGTARSPAAFGSREIDWIIGGGEKASNTPNAWSRIGRVNLPEQCRQAGAAFFLKQMWKRQPI